MWVLRTGGLVQSGSPMPFWGLCLHRAGWGPAGQAGALATSPMGLGGCGRANSLQPTCHLCEPLGPRRNRSRGPSGKYRDSGWYWGGQAMSTLIAAVGWPGPHALRLQAQGQGPRPPSPLEPRVSAQGRQPPPGPLWDRLLLPGFNTGIWGTKRVHGRDTVTRTVTSLLHRGGKEWTAEYGNSRDTYFSRKSTFLVGTSLGGDTWL